MPVSAIAIIASRWASASARAESSIGTGEPEITSPPSGVITAGAS